MKTTQIKEAALRSQSAKLRRKKYGLFTSKEKAERLESKASKIDAKADILRSRIESTKAKLGSAAKYKQIYSTGLNDVDSALKSRGKDLIEKMSNKKKK